MSDVFNKESLQFLEEVHTRNSREWYLENKETYQRVLLYPFQRMVSELCPEICKIDPKLNVMPTTSKAISRINRDIRFTRDKTLYRNTMWLTFVRRTKERNDYPAFFFEISPTYYRYGMGFFGASVKSMDLYRSTIMNKESEFIKIISDMANTGIFAPEGESYKRNKYNGNIAQIEPWYNKKNIYVVDNRDVIEEIFDFDALRERLLTGFSSLADFYHFLSLPGMGKLKEQA